MLFLRHRLRLRNECAVLRLLAGTMYTQILCFYGLKRLFSKKVDTRDTSQVVSSFCNSRLLQDSLRTTVSCLIFETPYFSAHHTTEVPADSDSTLWSRLRVLLVDFAFSFPFPSSLAFPSPVLLLLRAALAISWAFLLGVPQGSVWRTP